VAERARYSAYLRSAAWKARRESRLQKAGHRCEFVLTSYGGPQISRERCERRRYLTVHHNNYERLGHESDTDLSVLCWFHHMIEHLLWKACSCCRQPVLESDDKAIHWLTIMLSTLGIDIDRGPVNWKVLPNKELFLNELPKTCIKCEGYESS
jgi:hypothetical protein